jgi:hypothetical protein
MAINGIPQNSLFTPQPKSFAQLFTPTFPNISNETRFGLAYTGLLATAYPLVGPTPVSAAALLAVFVYLLYKLAASAASKLAHLALPAGIAAAGLATGMMGLETLLQAKETLSAPQLTAAEEWTEEFLEIEEPAPEEPWVKEFDDFVAAYESEKAALPEAAPQTTTWTAEFSAVESGAELASQFFTSEVAQMVAEFFKEGDWAGEFLG